MKPHFRNSNKSWLFTHITPALNRLNVIILMVWATNHDESKGRQSPIFIPIIEVSIGLQNVCDDVKCHKHKMADEEGASEPVVIFAVPEVKRHLFTLWPEGGGTCNSWKTFLVVFL